jgi:recombination protein RecA
MKPALIVVDSVSAMIPKQFLEGQVDEQQRIGLQAQLMSIFCNFITKHLKPANTCLMYCNQLRSMIKGQYDPGPKEETSGGKALKYYSSVRIKMRKSTIEKVNVKSRITGKTEKEPVNVMVKVSIVKNKIDKPYLSGPLYIRFGEGFDNITSIIELATNTNVVKKKGAFYSFDVNGESIFSGIQGKEQLRSFLEENPDKLQTLSNNIVFKEDAEAKKQAAEVEDTQEDAPEEDIENLEEMLEQASETFVKGKKGGKSKS